MTSFCEMTLSSYFGLDESSATRQTSASSVAVERISTVTDRELRRTDLRFSYKLAESQEYWRLEGILTLSRDGKMDKHPNILSNFTEDSATFLCP